MENPPNKYNRLPQIIKLLKFIITLDDLEIIKTTIEAIIELLEEQENNSPSSRNS